MSSTYNQSFREPSTTPQTSSVFLTPGNESEQVDLAPLNLTQNYLNHRALSSRPQVTNAPAHSGLVPKPFSFKVNTVLFSSRSAVAPAAICELPARPAINKSLIEQILLDQNLHHTFSGYSLDKDRQSQHLSSRP